MSQADILEPEKAFGHASGDENIPLARTALTSVALGHLMLILPAMAAFQDASLFEAYYLQPSILTVWIVGLALDLTVVVALLEGRLEDRKWLSVAAAALISLALLPWLEVYLGSFVDYGEIREMTPLPWATTHLGPLGSACAGIAAALAIRARNTSEDASSVTLAAIGALALATQVTLYVAFSGALF